LAVLRLIVHEVIFQKILHYSISHIIGDCPFQWCNTKRSWELFLSIDEPHDCNDLHLKGIFFLPEEVCGTICGKIAFERDQPTVSRTIGKIPITYAEYRWLLDIKWLNAEIIDAYISLMENSQDTIVLKTYFWEAIRRNRHNHKVMPKMVRGYIFTGLTLTRNEAFRRTKAIADEIRRPQPLAKNHISSILGRKPLDFRDPCASGEDNLNL
jgi:hypothetical protein